MTVEQEGDENSILKYRLYVTKTLLKLRKLMDESAFAAIIASITTVLKWDSLGLP